MLKLNASENEGCNLMDPFNIGYIIIFPVLIPLTYVHALSWFGGAISSCPGS